VNRVVPKNSFDDYTNTKEKKLFTDCVKRISWANKLSTETLNLSGKDIQEIQVFAVELKQKCDISKLLDIIDKCIPYHIIFWVWYEHQAYISASAKHPYPTNPNISVVDWTFTTDWFQIPDIPYSLHLMKNLDYVFKDLCIQIIGRPGLEQKSMTSIVENQKEIADLSKKIDRLKSAISKSKQFNQKVEYNLQLREAEKKLDKLMELSS